MVLADFSKIKTVFLDVDGVLTDGTVTVTEMGDQIRRFSVKDGYALQLAVKRGITVVIITGGRSKGTVDRLTHLGLQHIFVGVSDKREVLAGLKDEWGLKPEEMLFMGDDIPDLECMQIVGLPVCPYDAAEEIKAISKYISPKKGGEGCVRDVLEKIMKLQGLWYLDTEVKSI